MNTADGSEYSAHALLIASGSTYRRLNVPGEDKYIGAGIHFCATCDGPFYKDEPVAVIGGGNSAAEESLFLLRFVERITLLVRGKELKASRIIQDKVRADPKIEIRYFTEVVGFEGEGGKLTTVNLKNRQTGEDGVIRPAGVFVFIGLNPNTENLRDSPIQLNRWGFIVTGHDLRHATGDPLRFGDREAAFLETSIPGIFAAGDVRSGSTKQLASASGEGATAALLIREYLKSA